MSAKKAALVIQKLKTDLAILREALDKANRSDVGIVEQKLRIANAEMAKLRSVNVEMRHRVMALEHDLHLTRTAWSQGTAAGVGAGEGEGAGEGRKPAPPARPPLGPGDQQPPGRLAGQAQGQGQAQAQ